MGTTSVPRANYCLMKPSSGREHLGSQDQQLKTYIITGHDSLLDNFNITWSGGTVLLAVFATIGKTVALELFNNIDYQIKPPVIPSKYS